MYALASVAAATLLLSSASASAVPNGPLSPRETDSALAPWVTVGDDGKPSTVTPVLSTVDGTTTIVSGAPHDLTATVFTTTSYGKVETSTGTAPLATATGGEAGSFPICHNLDGDDAPWCQPTDAQQLFVGTTYYFLWDADYFTEPNTTVQVVGNFVNMTTGETIEQAFTSPNTAASWGFWSLKIDSSLLRHQSAYNITMTLASLPSAGNKATIKQGPKVEVTTRPGPTPNSGSKANAAALYIALPTVLGFILLCLFGTYLWNRKTRKIELGSIMGRGRRGYGVGKSSRSRMGLGKKNKASERVELMEREVEADGGELYRDAPARPRRDSDALGSLAGTPTDDRRMDFQRPSTREGGDGNLFRDEMRRQNGERL
ncbi:Uu.00g025170.m01.CDS01 [Anthostomella pinea]|uniref:Uu.00g025170.m01.CDS01 n=1 Tax=Anthostomella pinea TaxID=933095 RepID=A0AAI8YA30_9PEZI|nr:Uu.00g025170.m01.CDS01 [Anthostomella pinea]